jgi:flagellar hook-length control protein FliK
VPVPVHEQLAPRIVSLASGGDGEHRITLRVDPDDFGPVRVVAEVRGGDVAVVLHAGTDQGRDALRACLTDLRRDLEASGLRGSLDLAGGSTGGGQHRPAAHRQQHTAWLGDGGSAPAGPAQPVAVRIAGSAGLDLLV